MRFTSLALIISLSASGALAGCNCKCQDPSGEGPQWNDLTEDACLEQFPGENHYCWLNKVYHGDQHHQCSSSTCCIDSGAFNDWCERQGAPGAYCWD